MVLRVFSSHAIRLTLFTSILVFLASGDGLILINCLILERPSSDLNALRTVIGWVGFSSLIVLIIVAPVFALTTLLSRHQFSGVRPKRLFSSPVRVVSSFRGLLHSLFLSLFLFIGMLSFTWLQDQGIESCMNVALGIGFEALAVYAFALAFTCLRPYTKPGYHTSFKFSLVLFLAMEVILGLLLLWDAARVVRSSIIFLQFFTVMTMQPQFLFWVHGMLFSEESPLHPQQPKLSDEATKPQVR